MKNSTKKILIAAGGVMGGVVLASTGGSFLGLAIGGLLVRTGVLKASPTAPKEFLKIVTRTGTIVSNTVRGTVCTAAGIVVASNAGAMLGEAVAQRMEEKLSVVAPPPSVSRQAAGAQATDN